MISPKVYNLVALRVPKKEEQRNKRAFRVYKETSDMKLVTTQREPPT